MFAIAARDTVGQFAGHGVFRDLGEASLPIALVQFAGDVAAHRRGQCGEAGALRQVRARIRESKRAAR